jgi:hypothetical protein
MWHVLWNIIMKFAKASQPARLPVASALLRGNFPGASGKLYRQMKLMY